MYDAWTAYDPRAAPTRDASIAKRPRHERNDTNKSEAISFAAYRAIIDLFPAEAAAAGALMAELGYDVSDADTDHARPSGIGNAACKAVLDDRHQDGSNQLGDLSGGAPYSDYTGYRPVNTPDMINDPNRWQPLRVRNGNGGFVIQAYTAPFWGLVKPFNPKLKTPETPGPSVFPGAAYEAEVDRILQYSADLTDTQKVIAEYWADGPKSEQPPGHWSLFAKFVSQRDHHSIDQDVKMFFAESNAIFDAGIMAWAAKRQHGSVRPVTAVHFLKSGQPVRAWGGPYQGTQIMDGAAWQPYQAATLVTPPFPEYYSGHSIFSAAGAEVLRRFSGSDRFGASYTQSAHTSRVEPLTTPATDVTLSWRTFTDAANQAGLSRRYGGIHFMLGDLDARTAGRELGARDWHLAVAYFDGHPDDFNDNVDE